MGADSPAQRGALSGSGGLPPGTPGTPPRAGAQRAFNPTAVLLELEAEVRRQQTEKELVYHLLNETRRLLPFRQSFGLVRRGLADSYQVIGASSIAAIDRNVPMVRWIERSVAGLPAEKRDGRLPYAFDRGVCDAADDPDASVYPFSHALWLPMQRPDGTPLSGALMFAAEPWDEAHRRVAQRLAETYGHAWSALSRPERAWGAWLRNRRLRWIAAAAVLLACVFPVSMSALAPMEIVAADPAIVAAPMTGVVADILVAPNTLVQEGQPILRFEDTKLRNELELAQRKVQVAMARFASTSQAAIDSAEANREVAINKAELELATAQHAYARELMDKAILRAPLHGIAVYSDRRDWQGRPVETGQQIMKIANPGKTEFNILLPVQDSLLIHEGARVKIYLDSDPLRPIEAHLLRAGYQAEKTESGALAFRLAARADAGEAPASRIGTRGTAQVYGGKVPLIFYLLRRPITVARQTLGW